MSYAKNLLGIIRVKGIRSVVHSVVKNYIFAYEHRFVFWRTLSPDPSVVDPEYTYRLAEESDKTLLRVFSSQYRSSDLVARIVAGDWIFLGLHNGQPVAFQIVSARSRSRAPMSRFPLSPQQVWVVDIYTLPEYRRHHVAESLRNFRDRTLYDLGYRQSESSILARNIRSILFAMRANNFKIIYFDYLRVFGFRWMKIDENGAELVDRLLMKHHNP